jgi:EamA domain-containing membrane protein RarD
MTPANHPVSGLPLIVYPLTANRFDLSWVGLTGSVSPLLSTVLT